MQLCRIPPATCNLQFWRRRVHALGPQFAAIPSSTVGPNKYISYCPHHSRHHLRHQLAARTTHKTTAVPHVYTSSVVLYFIHMHLILKSYSHPFHYGDCTVEQNKYKSYSVHQNNTAGCFIFQPACRTQVFTSANSSHGPSLSLRKL